MIVLCIAMEVASIMVYICIPHLLIIMYISNAIIMVVVCELFKKNNCFRIEAYHHGMS